jgi:predicted Fe-Mo cluster-binding NifX family protein
MEIRIAVASSDGVTVNQHFGRARNFRVYRLVDNGFEFIEERATDPACSGQQHSDSALEQMTATIADCQGVVASQIGSGAIDVLIGQRTLPFTMDGSIEAALATLNDSKRLKFLRK